MSETVVFYADLNCPFCFATNERLDALQLARRVEWRGLQHEPDLPIPAHATAKANAELPEEIERLRQRAPEIEIRRPSFRPNSGPATGLLAAVAIDSVELAHTLRTAVFRALWHEGLDISDRHVLDAVMQSVGCPWPRHEASAATLSAWQDEWEHGPFQRRIPALRSQHGAVLLGFQDTRPLELFFLSGRYSLRDDDTCASD